MKVGYVGGFWSSNIGNAFYNIGALWFLREHFGGDNVYFVPDPPQVYWSNLDHDFDLISHLDLDLLIVSGPILGTILEKTYAKIFDAIDSRGGSIGFLSAGAALYTIEEAERVATFLKKYRVSFVFTRDSCTYALLKDRLETHLYDGICTSMYLSDAYVPPQLDHEYVVFNFDRGSEPVIQKNDDGWLVKSGMLRRRQTSLLGYSIVRTRSQSFVSSSRFFRGFRDVFWASNMYYSDLPFGYLSILKHSKLVFSDRVHTCAAALIYGAECMYIKGSHRSRDGRSNLFSRLGVADIFHNPMRLDLNYINMEKQKMLQQFRAVCGLNSAALVSELDVPVVTV
jgi:hypothetical protein